MEAALRGFVAQSKALQDEHFRSIRPLQVLAAEARQLQWRVADLVNAAYGLTPAEVSSEAQALVESLVRQRQRVHTKDLIHYGCGRGANGGRTVVVGFQHLLQRKSGWGDTILQKFQP